MDTQFVYNAKNHGAQEQARMGPFFSARVQPKLTINAPGDVYEQEADAMADKVMKMSIPGADSHFFKPSISSLQRKCAACEQDEKQLNRKEASNGETEAGGEVSNYISSLSSGGQRLPESARQFFEPRFGHDFSGVRVHTDSVAAKSAQSINALAYTTGNNIVFNEGQYAPGSDSGKRLMAHELTHVVQQGQGIHMIQRFDPIEYVPVVGTIWKTAKCAWRGKKYSKLQDECTKEYKNACGDDVTNDSCDQFMDGTQWPSDAIDHCINKKDPELFKDFITSCAKVATMSYGKTKL